MPTSTYGAILDDRNADLTLPPWTAHLIESDGPLSIVSGGVQGGEFHSIRNDEAVIVPAGLIEGSYVSNHDIDREEHHETRDCCVSVETSQTNNESHIRSFCETAFSSDSPPSAFLANMPPRPSSSASLRYNEVCQRQETPGPSRRGTVRVLGVSVANLRDRFSGQSGLASDGPSGSQSTRGQERGTEASQSIEQGITSARVSSLRGPSASSTNAEPALAVGAARKKGQGPARSILVPPVADRVAEAMLAEQAKKSGRLKHELRRTVDEGPARSGLDPSSEFNLRREKLHDMLRRETNLTGSDYYGFRIQVVQNLSDMGQALSSQCTVSKMHLSTTEMNQLVRTNIKGCNFRESLIACHEGVVQKYKIDLF